MPKISTADLNRSIDPLCLDYANSLQWHASATPVETMFSYDDLVEWCEKEGLISSDWAKNLLRKARRNSEETERAFERAMVFREVIYRIFAAIGHEKTPSDTDLIELNEVLQEATNGARVVKTGSHFKWDWEMKTDKLDLPLYPIALSAAELLVSEDRGRVGQCADDRGCGWLFLDTSKNHTRRWCDINDCGNRAKQRRHYERNKKAKIQPIV